MNNSPRLHIVSFQWPSPPNYGGVIEVFHKLRALKKEGADVTLHSYCYGDRLNPQTSSLRVDKTFLYRRRRSAESLLSRLPFIVKSRNSGTLLRRLGALPPGTPVLFEGLHTCRFLDHPDLKDKIKIVRTHNVEHEYYSQLAGNSKGLKRLFFKLEARKLRKFEKILSNADVILAISPADRDYFARRFPQARVEYVPCFYDDSHLESDTALSDPLSSEKSATGPYILYHGNLGVAENVRAVEYVINHLLPHFKGKAEFVIAGKACPASLREKIKSIEGVTLVDTPSDVEMARLINDASVTLLFTNQNTGIKLKLLDTMSRTRGNIVANSEMIGDSRLEEFIMIADDPEAQIKAIEKALAIAPDAMELRGRRQRLKECFSTSANARRILEIISDFSLHPKPL